MALTTSFFGNLSSVKQQHNMKDQMCTTRGQKCSHFQQQEQQHFSYAPKGKFQ